MVTVTPIFATVLEGGAAIGNRKGKETEKEKENHGVLTNAFFDAIQYIGINLLELMLTSLTNVVHAF